MDYVCNRCLFSIPSKVEMAEEQEYLRYPISLADNRLMDVTQLELTWVG